MKVFSHMRKQTSFCFKVKANVKKKKKKSTANNHPSDLQNNNRDNTEMIGIKAAISAVP